jgi:hypothetical protein
VSRHFFLGHTHCDIQETSICDTQGCHALGRGAAGELGGHKVVWWTRRFACARRCRRRELETDDSTIMTELYSRQLQSCNSNQLTGLYSPVTRIFELQDCTVLSVAHILRRIRFMPATHTAIMWTRCRLCVSRCRLCLSFVVDCVPLIDAPD